MSHIFRGLHLYRYADISKHFTYNNVKSLLPRGVGWHDFNTNSLNNTRVELGPGWAWPGPRPRSGRRLPRLWPGKLGGPNTQNYIFSALYHWVPAKVRYSTVPAYLCSGTVIPIYEKVTKKLWRETHFVYKYIYICIYHSMPIELMDVLLRAIGGNKSQYA